MASIGFILVILLIDTIVINIPIKIVKPNKIIGIKGLVTIPFIT